MDENTQPRDEQPDADTEGHATRGKAALPAEDADTEGHMVKAPNPRRDDEDGDDTEGHAKASRF